MTEYKYEDHWPQTHKLDLNTIAGSIEAGQDLYLIGSFGGFGGCILYAHADLERAIKHCKEINNASRGPLMHVFEMKIKRLGGE